MIIYNFSNTSENSLDSLIWPLIQKSFLHILVRYLIVNYFFNGNDDGDTTVVRILPSFNWNDVNDEKER